MDAFCPRRRAAPALVAVGGLIGLMLAAYVASYLYLSDAAASSSAAVYRHFRRPWQKTFYAPAGWLESKATGNNVAVADGDGLYFFGTVSSTPEPPPSAPP